MGKEFDKAIEEGMEQAEKLAAGYRVLHFEQEKELQRDDPDRWNELQSLIAEIQKYGAELSKPADERAKPMTELFTNLISDAAMGLSAMKDDSLPSQVLMQLAEGTRRVELQLAVVSMLKGDK